MTSTDDLSGDERVATDLAAELRDTGNLHPLIARLRGGEIGPEHARDVLQTLAELDPDLLVQITLDGLITTYLDDAGLALQPRRIVRAEEGSTGA